MSFRYAVCITRVKEGQNSELVQTRVPRSIKDKIDEEVGDGKDYRNTSEFVLLAIRWYLDYLENQRLSKYKVTIGDKDI